MGFAAYISFFIPIVSLGLPGKNPITWLESAIAGAKFSDVVVATLAIAALGIYNLLDQIFYEKLDDTDGGLKLAALVVIIMLMMLITAGLYFFGAAQGAVPTSAASVDYWKYGVGITLAFALLGEVIIVVKRERV